MTVVVRSYQVGPSRPKSVLRAVAAMPAMVAVMRLSSLVDAARQAERRTIRVASLDVTQSLFT